MSLTSPSFLVPIFFHVSLMFSIILTGLQFSFNPSPNITTLQSAVFRCTVDGVHANDIVSVHWSVGGTSTSSPSWQSYSTNNDIVTDGAGTHNTTLTIPGDPSLNGTVVQCVASGLVDGEGYVNTTSDTLYIQGMIKCT